MKAAKTEAALDLHQAIFWIKQTRKIFGLTELDITKGPGTRHSTSFYSEHWRGESKSLRRSLCRSLIELMSNFQSRE